MEVIVANNIIQRDLLSVRNILIADFDEYNPTRIRVKIADFGMSSLLESSASNNNSSYYYYGPVSAPSISSSSAATTAATATSGGSAEDRGRRLALPRRWMAPESFPRNRWSEKTDRISGEHGWEKLSQYVLLSFPVMN